MERILTLVKTRFPCFSFLVYPGVIMNNNSSSPRLQQEPNSGVKALSKLLPVAIVITLTNGLVFVMFYRRKSLRTSSNYLLLSLAICDFLTGTINIPYFIVFSFQVVPLAMSKNFGYWMYVLHTLMAVSAAYHILIITAEKYLAIIKPLRHYLVTKKTVLRVLLGIWITSAFAAVVPIFWDESNSRYIWYIIHATVCIVLVFFVPYTFMIYAFTAMFKAISKRERPSIHRDTPNLQQKNNNDRKCVLVFASMAAIFAFCWLPYFTIMLAVFVNLYLKSGISASIDNAAQAFAIIRYMTSIANPLLYTFFKRDFRLALRNRPLRRTSTSMPLESILKQRSQSVSSQVKRQSRSIDC
ncbi:trace amine-associated receptor 2-like [Oculina patagonica]